MKRPETKVNYLADIPLAHLQVMMKKWEEDVVVAHNALMHSKEMVIRKELELDTARRMMSELRSELDRRKASM